MILIIIVIADDNKDFDNDVYIIKYVYIYILICNCCCSCCCCCCCSLHSNNGCPLPVLSDLDAFATLLVPRFPGEALDLIRRSNNDNGDWAELVEAASRGD